MRPSLPHTIPVNKFFSFSTASPIFIVRLGDGNHLEQNEVESQRCFNLHFPEDRNVKHFFKIVTVHLCFFF